MSLDLIRPFEESVTGAHVTLTFLDEFYMSMLCFDEIIRQFGIFKEVLLDQVTKFLGKMFEGCCKHIGVKKKV